MSLPEDLQKKILIIKDLILAELPKIGEISSVLALDDEFDDNLDELIADLEYLETKVSQPDYYFIPDDYNPFYGVSCSLFINNSVIKNLAYEILDLNDKLQAEYTPNVNNKRKTTDLSTSPSYINKVKRLASEKIADEDKLNNNNNHKLQAELETDESECALQQALTESALEYKKPRF